MCCQYFKVNLQDLFFFFYTMHHSTFLLAVCMRYFGPTCNCWKHTCSRLLKQSNYGLAAESSAFHITDHTYSLYTSAVRDATPLQHSLNSCWRDGEIISCLLYDNEILSSFPCSWFLSVGYRFPPLWRCFAKCSLNASLESL